MPSTYTLNNGIELIGNGEQSGTWGATTNVNLGLIDAALDGHVSVTLLGTGSTGSPNALPISDGISSNGRNRLVIFTDAGDLGGTAYVQLTPNDAQKIMFIRNALSASRSILVFQGNYSASTDYEIPAGTTAAVFFDGGGTSAVVENVFNNARFDAVSVAGTVTATGFSGGGVVTESGTQTLTNKTLTSPTVNSISITGEITEEVVALSGTTVELDPANGTLQTHTLTGNTAYTEALTSGQSLTLMIDDGTDYSITWPTMTWVNNGGVAPTLATSGYTVVGLWKVSTTLYGALISGTA